MSDLAVLYEQLPRIECKGLCARSCGPVMAEIQEADACGASYTLVGHEERLVAAFAIDRKMRCHLLKNGRCTVYENRPTVCRLWGVVESMPCLWGCVPDRYLSHDEGHEFLRLVKEACA